MDVLHAILAEANDAGTWVLLAGLVVALLLGRVARDDEGKRFKGTLFLSVAHVVAIIAAGSLRVFDAAATKPTRATALVLGVLMGTAVVGNLLFDFLLPRLRVRLPRIAADLLLAAGAIAGTMLVAKGQGVQLSSLLATSAVLTAVLGFAFQDTLGNVIGGIALQTDSSLRVGDWVRTGDVSGRIVEIRWRYTAIETRNWETVFVPNSMLMKGQVTVLGRRAGAPALWRRWVYFHVDFRTAPSDVMQTVVDALRSQPLERVAADPPPQCILMGIEDSYARYAVRYWLTDFAFDDPTDSLVRTRVYFALRRAGISLAIPAAATFVTMESQARTAHKHDEEHARRMKALSSVELLSHLSDDDRAHLADSLRFAPFTAGEVLTRQGAEAHWLYLITKGEASVRVREGGLEREVAQLHAGQFFGEMSLMTGAPRSATVTAKSDVECYRLDRTAFQEVLSNRPELAEPMAATLARRRQELVLAREGLDDEAKKKRLHETERDLVHRIRNFLLEKKHHA